MAAIRVWLEQFQDALVGRDFKRVLDCRRHSRVDDLVGDALTKKRQLMSRDTRRATASAGQETRNQSGQLDTVRTFCVSGNSIAEACQGGVTHGVTEGYGNPCVGPFRAAKRNSP